MAWFNRPEGFITKSFDDLAPEVAERTSIVETAEAVYMVGPAGYDIAILDRDGHEDDSRFEKGFCPNEQWEDEREYRRRW